ncbi:MAG: AAA family ATPase, partial [Gaiellaceae bacterium]
MASSRATAEGLLERDDALAALDGALAAVRAGSGRIVLVAGEAGIGKTSLVRTFSDAPGKRARVLWGACDALFTPRPLGPLHDIAQHAGPRLRHVLSSNSDRQSLLAVLLEELSSPVSVVVFDDVHWADEATLDALKYLGRRIERAPCLLVLTYRDDEVGLEHPLRVLLGDLPGRVTTRIQLAPLSEPAVGLLAKQADRPAEGVYA